MTDSKTHTHDSIDGSKLKRTTQPIRDVWKGSSSFSSGVCLMSRERKNNYYICFKWPGWRHHCEYFWTARVNWLSILLRVLIFWPAYELSQGNWSSLIKRRFGLACPAVCQRDRPSIMRRDILLVMYANWMNNMWLGSDHQRTKSSKHIKQ